MIADQLKTEIHFYFRHASAFHAHKANGREDDARESLDELLMLWFHSSAPLIQRRCATILEGNGWAPAMAELCEQAAH